MRQSEELKKKFLGSILGSVIGDAWGANYEGLDYRSIQETIQDFSSISGRYTDDSEMMKGVLESLLFNKGEFNGSHMAQLFVKNFDYTRGYGAGAASILMQIRNGQPWNRPAKIAFNNQGSYGNGAAMRICPAALLYHTDLVQLQQIVKKISMITHTHQLGIEGAILQAAAVALATQKDPETINQKEFVEKLLKLSLSPIYKQKLVKVKDFLDNPPTVDIIIQELGVNITAPGSVPMAIFNFLNSPFDFRNVLFSSITYGGDTDTIACMAGAIVGAFLGVDEIPMYWIQRVEDSNFFIKMGEKLFELFLEKNT
ncbi:MAG: ADP-ribosylglycohydrolase family protein [Candidatus Hodarchaeota archaeon]